MTHGTPSPAAAAAAAGASPPPPLSNGALRNAEHPDAPRRPLAELCSALHERIAAFLEGRFEDPLLQRTQAQTRISLGVVRKALEDYSLDELALSFNGGKDCLVLLILFLSALAPHHHPPTTSSSSISSTTSPPEHIQSVYVMPSHPFAEVDRFVDDCVRTYGLELSRYALPMKTAFETYLRERPGVRAVFVGTRRTDPHGACLTHFDLTDHGWPRFMRVHPVIDWHYQEVWAFLRHLEIPYCELYDKGYTSLGGTTDTHPNPALRKGDAEESFRPAYELVEDEQERLGRDGVKSDSPADGKLK